MSEKLDREILNALSDGRRLTQSEIAEQLGIRQGTVSKAVKQLLTNGQLVQSRLSDGNATRYSAVPSQYSILEYPHNHADIPGYSILRDGEMLVYRIPRHVVPERPGPDLTLYLTYQDYYNPHLAQSVTLRWLDIRHDPLPNSYRNARYEIVEPDGRITHGEPLPLMEYQWINIDDA